MEKEKTGIVFFERKDNKVIKNQLYRGHDDIIFRDNVSFLSTLNQYGISEVKFIYDFFNNSIINVNYGGLNDGAFKNPYYVAQFYALNSDFLTFAKDIIKRFDTGIKNIVIKKRVNEKQQAIYYPEFEHETTAEKNKFLIAQESQGTVSLFCDLYYYCQALYKGSVICLDEFDINLHPDILPYLLELFIKKDNNPRCAQLLFTTHNDEIMDLTKKYRTYLFNKESGESFCYRLDELPSESYEMTGRLLFFISDIR